MYAAARLVGFFVVMSAVFLAGCSPSQSPQGQVKSPPPKQVPVQVAESGDDLNTESFHEDVLLPPEVVQSSDDSAVQVGSHVFPGDELHLATPDVTVSNDLESAAIHVELGDFGQRTAPRNELMKTVGSVSGVGLEGRGSAASRSVMLRAYGGNVPIELQRGSDAFGLAELRGGTGARVSKPSTLPTLASRLMLGDQDSLPLRAMQVEVQVDGFRARVLIDCYYYNDRPGRLEGNFQLRLPDDASLFCFAFGDTRIEAHPDIKPLAQQGVFGAEPQRFEREQQFVGSTRHELWQNLKEARVVPRQKAAQAYGETVRRRIDPALVEWTGAGVFNARVFPLVQNQLHRIVIGYDVNLSRNADDCTFDLNLPRDVPEWSVDVNVAAVPGVTADLTPAAEPFVASGRACYRLDSEHEKERSIRLRLTHLGETLLRGTDRQAGDFFVARFVPQLPKFDAPAASPRAVFLLDTSLSSHGEKFPRWLDLMRATLQQNRDTLKEFAVLFFSVDAHWWRPAFVENTPENVDALLKDCQALALEGATDFGQALSAAAEPAWLAADERDARPDIFLYSDGAITWGESNRRRLAQTLQNRAGRLFAFKTGQSGTDSGVLDYLAREMGGAVFSVPTANDVLSAATAHRRPPLRLLNVSLEGCRDLLVAGRPESIYPGQELLIVGRGRPADTAELVLRVQHGDETRDIRTRFEHVLDSKLAAAK